jgi:hypothetical protein
MPGAKGRWRVRRDILRGGLGVVRGGGPYGGVVWVMAGGGAFILLWRVGVRVPAWYFAAVMREGSHDVDVSINQHSSCHSLEEVLLILFL